MAHGNEIRTHAFRKRYCQRKNRIVTRKEKARKLSEKRREDIIQAKMAEKFVLLKDISTEIFFKERN